MLKKLPLYFIILKLSQFIKLSIIAAPYWLGSFSLSQFIMPISGLILTNKGMLAIFILQALWKILTIKSLTLITMLYCISYHIPNFLGAVYMSSSDIILKSSILLASAGLFVIHPIGTQIPLYTLYWVLPLALAIFKTDNLYLKSLATTLTAHAVGTVIHIYTFQTDVAFWTNLAKIIWIERLIFSLGIYLTYLTYKLALKLITAKIENKESACAILQ